MKLFYGISSLKIDITESALSKCVSDSILHIPTGSDMRDGLFTDPLFGVHKFIYIEGEVTAILDEYTDIHINLKTNTVIKPKSKYRLDPALLVNGVYKPKLCLGFVCKNEAPVILDLLNSTYKYISYWVICDTGSTDDTVAIIKKFYEEKQIPGELFVDEWVNFQHNKSLLFERCYQKMDYILHIDADDMLEGNFNFEITEHKTSFYLNSIAGGSLNYKSTHLFNSALQWRFLGVAHTVCKFLDKDVDIDSGDLSDKDFYIKIRSGGARAKDPNKFLKDALALQGQFFETLYDDPHQLNSRSAFYTAQSYHDQGMYKESIQWYRLYTKLKNTWIEEYFESHKRIAELYMKLNFDLSKIIEQVDLVNTICADRAEISFAFGRYLNNINKNDLAYKYLSHARKMDFDTIKNKYILFLFKHCYGKYINDELAVACYHTKRYAESIKYIKEIIDDPEFADQRPRLLENLNFALKETEKDVSVVMYV